MPLSKIIHLLRLKVISELLAALVNLKMRFLCQITLYKLFSHFTQKDDESQQSVKTLSFVYFVKQDDFTN